LSLPEVEIFPGDSQFGAQLGQHFYLVRHAHIPRRRETFVNARLEGQ
jgi:hypothetical protein